MRKKLKFSFLLTAILVVVGNFSTALASTVSGSSKSSSSVTVLADVKLKDVQTSSPKCHWISKGYNSGENANGTLYWFPDTHMKVCPSKSSSTGWAKVAGGKTGRNCGNPVSFTKPKSHVVKGKVSLKPYFSVKATAAEKVALHGECGDASASASAIATGHGNSMASAKGDAQAKASASAIAKASAKASASLICVPTAPPVVTTPPVVPPLPGPVLSCPSGYEMNSQNVCVQIVVNCSAGQVKDSKGNCVTQTNTAEQNCLLKNDATHTATWDSVSLMCTIIQINANCSNVIVEDGSGTIIGTSQEGNCNTTVVQPPPTCQPPTMGNYPNCYTAPTITLNNVQEVDTNGTNVIVAKAKATSGNSVKVCFTADYGKLSPSCVSTTGTGSPVELHSTYTAPVDVSSDTITATVYDLTSGLQADTSITFPVMSGDPPTGRPV